MTKIENKQFLENQTVSINKIVRNCVDDLEDITDYKHIGIAIDETSELKTEMDVSLANIMISNLIKNAAFHNIENGKIEIYISNTSLKICNTGKNMMLDEKQIFTRFYKSDSKINNTGLGLAIAKAIADLYGITIRYHFENSLHCFEVTFVSK